MAVEVKDHSYIDANGCHINRFRAIFTCDKCGESGENIKVYYYNSRHLCKSCLAEQFVLDEPAADVLEVIKNSCFDEFANEITDMFETVKG